ncbi:lysozyme-like [Periplaneta americana]|uniref:lysozyme-like n=1 Tax=Periplaneta americana TaxID=6978 RepID=UPI0037E7CE3E
MAGRVVLLLLLGLAHAEVSELCMGCLCEANTRCDRSFQCEGGDCGLFRISQPYWEDAGRPLIKDDDAFSDGAFKRCVLDPFCAARAVQGYMKRFSKDCNGDQQIDCEDYALLHYQGAGCEGDPDEDYEEFRSTLNRCLAEVAKKVNASTTQRAPATTVS